MAGIISGNCLTLAFQNPVPIGKDSPQQIVAFRVEGDISEKQLQELGAQISSDLGVQVVTSALLRRYHTVAIGPSNMPNLKERVAETIKQLYPLATVSELPISISDGALRIPTGEVVVQFRKGVRQRDAERELSKRELTIVQRPSPATEERYVVRDTDILHLMKQTASLQNSPLVTYAEPNYLAFMKRP